MTKKQKLFITALGLSVLIGVIIYFGLFTPEKIEIRQLEKNYERCAEYDDQLACGALREFSPERLRMFAEKGNPVSRYLLGNYYRDNKQERLARNWYEKAESQNIALAYREMALLDRIENRHKYLELLQKAGELGDRYSQMLKILEDLDDDNDKLTAFMRMEKIAQQDYTWAQVRLGRWYFDGRVISKDWEKAFYWFNRAYENMHKYHQNNLISMRISGENLDPNIVRRELAALYVVGVGTDKDEQKAEELLAEISKGWRKDQISIRQIKRILIQNKNDLSESVQEKIQSLEEDMKSNPDDLIFLGEKEFDDSKAKEYFGLACDAGSQEGCDKYRELNEKGIQ